MGVHIRNKACFFPKKRTGLNPVLWYSSNPGGRPDIFRERALQIDPLQLAHGQKKYLK